MRQKKLIKWFVMFLLVMLLFTFLSRAADSVSVAKVRTKTLQNQVITHEVIGSGEVEGTKELAVFTAEGQKVEQALVEEGQSVKAGDVLLRLSMDELAQAITEKKEEYEQAKRKISDLVSQGTVEEEKNVYTQERAQENYNVAVSNGDINIANAQMEIDVARQKLQNYYDSSAFRESGGDISTEQAFVDDIRAKEEALNQVIMNRNQEVLEAQRALEDAKLPESPDGTLENARGELRTVKNALKKLKQLRETEGKVKAPSDGVVKSVAAVTGSVTSQEAALILYETDGELRMVGDITKEDVKYISEGADAKVKDSSGEPVQNAVVAAVKSGEGEDSFQVTLHIPEGAMAIGETGEFTVAKDAGPFNSCIPVSALHEDNGRVYVYAVDTEKSALGEVLTALKIEVTVQERNQRLAAVQSGSLTSDQQIIVETDREITGGSRVRLQDS